MATRKAPKKAAKGKAAKKAAPAKPKKKPAKAKAAPKAKKVSAAPKAKAKPKGKSASAAMKKAAPKAAAKPANAAPRKAGAVKAALKGKPAAAAPSKANGKSEAKAKAKVAARGAYDGQQIKMTTTLLQTVEIPAPPVTVYRAYLDPPVHAKITGGAASIDPRVGGRMSAHDGYIVGRFVELVDGAKIVQTWRASEWPDGYDDSRLELTLTPNDGGTRVTMVHESVPTSLAKGFEEGWIENYWEPMRRYFAGEEPRGASADLDDDDADFAEDDAEDDDDDIGDAGPVKAKAKRGGGGPVKRTPTNIDVGDADDDAIPPPIDDDDDDDLGLGPNKDYD